MNPAASEKLRQGSFYDILDCRRHAMDDDNKMTNKDLYEKQIKILETFLQTGAISEAQYKKSADALKEKMNIC